MRLNVAELPGGAKAPPTMSVRHLQGLCGWCQVQHARGDCVCSNSGGLKVHTGLEDPVERPETCYLAGNSNREPTRSRGLTRQHSSGLELTTRRVESFRSPECCRPLCKEIQSGFQLPRAARTSSRCGRSPMINNLFYFF
ncbi:Sulfate adenylyltransferase [Trichinella spiralis]|uniref:Sulfate adenylyltransferase n=1 Tax=Trichinella spiralis TaxID=6334 RepID=A0ABR3K765_TRISP